MAKPNIILVCMDNFGWGELGVYGGGVLRGAATLHINKLASGGIRLLNFNVEAQCTPSRAAIMTDRYAARTSNGSILIETPIYGLKQWEVAAYGVHVPPLNHKVKLEITHITIDTKRHFCHFKVSKK